MSYLLLLIINLFIGGLALWIAAKLTSVDLKLKDTIVAVAIAAVIGVIPIIGWPLSIIALLLLLKKYSSANIWPDILILVIVSRLVSFLIYFFLPANLLG